MRRALRLAWLTFVLGCVDLRPPTEVRDVVPAEASDMGPPDRRGDAGPDGEGHGEGDGGGSDAPLDGDGPTDDAATEDGSPAGEVAAADTPPAPGDVPQSPDLSPPLAVAGADCGDGAQCASGFCVDSVCCATACGGLCQACNLAGTRGVCSPVPLAQDPRGVCPKQPESSCKNAGGCNGAGACLPHPATTVCQAGTCSAGIEFSARRCDGMGSCGPVKARFCGAYACNGTTCGPTCSAPAHCSTGSVCWASACIPRANAPALVWRFDEPDGITANDASGNELHGTYVGMPGLPAVLADVPPTSFPNPRSRGFAAGGKQGVMRVMTPLLRPTTSFTVMLWYKGTKLDAESFPPSADVLSGGDQYVLRLRANDVQFVKRTATTHLKCDAPSTTHLDGKWHHLAAVATPDGEKVYIDGVERGSCNEGSPVTYDRGNELWIARHGNGQLSYDFEGAVDDVRLYTVPLSAPQIAGIAAGGN